MVKVKSDGNGGLDFNIQKIVLRKYGPLALAAMFVFSGMGSKIADEVWSLIVTKKAQANEMVYLRKDIDENEKAIKELQAELRDELRAVRQELRQLTEAIMASKEKQ